MIFILLNTTFFGFDRFINLLQYFERKKIIFSNAYIFWRKYISNFSALKNMFSLFSSKETLFVCTRVYKGLQTKDQDTGPLKK